MGARPGAEVYPTHHFYGHQSVLATYCGRVDGGPPIFAQVQHGWQHDAAFHDGTKLPAIIPKLVWSTRNAQELRALGATQVTAIGAPFTYLDAMLGVAPNAGTGTLVYPFHQVHSADMHGDPNELRDAIAEREAGAGRVTVCLYFRDFADLATRRTYEEAGWRVITHGDRSDPAFLLRQWAEIASHAKVVTNRTSTALWYGGLLDRHIEVYGPIFGSRGSHERTWFDDVQRSRWPDLFRGGIRPGAAREVAIEQLGADNRLAPEELEVALGWRGVRRVAGRGVAASLALNRLRHRNATSPTARPAPTTENRTYR